MSLLLPVAVFLVFAAIFVGRLRRASCASRRGGRRGAQRRRRGGWRGRSPVSPPSSSAGQDARRRTRCASACAGPADVGVIRARAARSLSRRRAGSARRPSLVLVDPVRAVAAQLHRRPRAARVLRARCPTWRSSGVARVLQDGFVTPRRPQQEDELARELRPPARRDTLDRRSVPAAPKRVQLESLVERETVAGPARARRHVAYYAGGDRRAVPALLRGARGAVAARGARDGHPRPPARRPGRRGGAGRRQVPVPRRPGRRPGHA